MPLSPANLISSRRLLLGFSLACLAAGLFCGTEIKAIARSPAVPCATVMSESEITDLVNPAQKIVGTWQGARHRKQYFADGTMVTDPHLVPNAPRAQWHIEGDRLIETYPDAGVRIAVRILSITDRELVTADEQGHTYRAKRVPDEQAEREKAN
jgi:hypothetical protein